MNTKISLDKIVLEYVDVPLSFLDAINQEGELSNIKSIEGFHYHRCLQIHKKNGAYIKFYYQSKYEVWKPVGKLRIETHPRYLKTFSILFEKLKEISKAIYFISTDLAFDIPLPLKNVFVISNTGRCMNLFNGTRYFGGKGQRGQNGYCRIYDKKRETIKKKGLIIDELTRVEIVYKPGNLVELKDISLNQPSINKFYSCKIIKTNEEISPIYRALLICLQNGEMTINEFSRHYRRVLKNQLKNQEAINFDQLISNEWVKQIFEINSLLL